jgi:glycerophosphoryl diester phosphodiesterase
MTPLIFAHRGASAEALENTLPAFRLARDRGADGVELDAWRCRSGEVVVFHDDDLRRLAGRPERVVDLSLADVRDVVLQGGERIPTLAEVMAETSPMTVNVELKTSRALSGLAVARAVAGELRDRGETGRALVSSFNPFALAAFRVARREVPIGLLVHSKQGRPLREGWSARPLGCAAIHPESVMVDAARMARWRRAGLQVNTWTVDDEDEIQRVAALGVNAIITNDPRRARAALR